MESLLDLTLIAADGGFLLEVAGRRLPCAIGASGVVAAKREGDGGTPTGRFPMRRVFFRQDRLPAPTCGAKHPIPIEADFGWSDDVGDPAHYNRLVRLPYAHSHERMMREDAVYDVVVELGYNDDPPVPGLGSAIFMHVARPDYSGTEGCVALKLEDLLWLLETSGGDGTIVVPPELAGG